MRINSLIILFSTFLFSCSFASAPQASDAPVQVKFVIKNQIKDEADSFILGEKIFFEIQIKNTTDKDIKIQRTGPGYDIFVKQGDKAIWSRNFDQFFAQVISEQTIKAFGVWTLSATWLGQDNNRHRLNEGDYDVLPRLALFIEGERIRSPKSKRIGLIKK